MAGSTPRFDATPAFRAFTAMILACALGACAGMPKQDALQVTVADIESLEGEGMEMRMAVKLRVQNPNDFPVQYDGVYLRLDVMGKTFATGVSDERGSVPRYSEAIVTVPMTVSTLRVMANVLGLFGGQMPDRLKYNLYGKLDGPAFGATRFELQGDFAPPGATAARGFR